jgi:hypothetical protein
MRAKFQVQEVGYAIGGTKLSMCPVGASDYGPNGENEDNDFARYTPTGELRMFITNPEIKETFKPGDNFYIDFTRAD